MTIGRRDFILGGLGAGLAVAVGPRVAAAHDTDMAEAFSTYGIVPANGAINQTTMLQRAADAAAQSGT